MKSYEQYCPVACALDVVGDRWTLLVLRELSLGPQRFTDLKRQLHGIPPKLLVERLDTLQANGIVERRGVDDGARHVYALTADGEAVREPLRALSRFGIRFLPDDTPPDGLPPRRALSALLLTYARPVPEAAGARWRIVLDGTPLDVVVDGHGVPRFADGITDTPDDVLDTRIADLIALRRAGRAVRSDDSPLARAFGLSQAAADYAPA